MQIGIGLNVFRGSAVVGVGIGGGDAVEKLRPSLLLDFTAGARAAIGSVSDQLLDLDFTRASYMVAATTDPDYGVGQYLVEG